MRRRFAPGVTTAELDEVAERALRAHGARHAPKSAFGFPDNSCISANDEAVGIPGERVIAPGDVVKLDVVAEKDGYHADAAITVTVPPVSDENRRLADCARAAFAHALQVARAGYRVADIGRALELEVHRLHGPARARRPRRGPHRPRAPHHPELPSLLERTAHRGPRHRRRADRLNPANPYRRGSDGWTLRTPDGSIAAHHEHTIIITRRQPIILTAA